MHFSLIFLVILGFLPALATSATMSDGSVDLTDKDKMEISGFHYLTDPSGELDLVRIEGRDDWKVHEKSTFSFGFAKDAYWIAFRVQDRGPTPRKWVLELQYPPLDSIDFYLVAADGSVIRKSGGDHLPFQVRDIKYRTPNFTFETQAGQSATIYLKIRSDSSIQGGITLWTPERFIEKASDELIGFALYCGLAVAMIIYNFFLFLRIRDLSYLYYIVYVFFYVYTFVSVFGIAFQYCTPDWPMLSNTMVPFSISIGALFVLLFSQEFLQIQRYSQWVYRLFQVLIGWAAISAVVALFSYSLSIKSGTLLTLVGSPLILFAGIVCVRKGYRPARFFVLAFIALLVGIFVHQLIPFGILKPGLFTTYSAHFGSAFELLMLSIALGDKMKFEQSEARRVIERLNQELKGLNEGLEARVEAQTRDIRSMLQHINLGIFTIVEEGRVHKDYSAFLEQIFMTANLDGTKAVDLLFASSDADADAANQVRSILESTIGEPGYTFAMNEAALTRELRKTTSNGQQKILEIDWSPIVNRKDIIEKILVTVRDVTQFRELQEIAEGKKKELEFIAEIVPVSREHFARFINSGERHIEENERLINLNVNFSPEALKIIFINLHTLKGTARSLGFKKLTEAVHNAEHYAGSLQKGKENWDQARLLQDLTLVKEVFEYYRHVNDRILERGTGRNSIELDVARVEQILQEMAKFNEQLVAPDFRNLFQKIDVVLCKAIYQSGSVLFNEIFAATHQLAKDLGKEQPKLDIGENHISFSRDGSEILRNIFNHLIRNSMDHGIETKDERLVAGKSPCGTISLTFNDTPAGLELRYADDGRGLAMQMIRAIASIRGIIEADKKLSPEELALLIFQPGFTTSQAVTEISGRGVGMSAIKNYTEKAGGTLSLELLPLSEGSDENFRAFAITICLPHRYCRSFLPLGVVSEDSQAA